MAAGMPFTIGSRADCADGPCGHVTRVIVDPVARTVTHIVVQPPRWQGLGRLVPVDLVSATAGEVTLRCTGAEFEELELAEETQFISGSYDYAPYGPAQVSAWPYYGLAGLGPEGELVAVAPQTITYDSVPLGEVEVRRGARVHATDGSIGRVQGLVIDPRSHHVTHVLLQEGHLWGRKEVAIPIRAVTAVDDAGISLSISKREVADLPAVTLDRPDGTDG